jgi:hypothetical protein
MADDKTPSIIENLLAKMKAPTNEDFNNLANSANQVIEKIPGFGTGQFFNPGDKMTPSANTPVTNQLSTGFRGTGKDMPELIKDSNTNGGAPHPEEIHPSLVKHKGDFYAAMSDKNVLDDNQFKDFVDKHPDIPGIGYVGGGKGVKFQRVIEKPDDSKGGGGGIDLSGFTRADLPALASLVHGVASKQYAAAIGQQNADTRKATLENKGNEDVDKIIGTFGKTIDASGAATINPELAYFKLGINKTPLPSSLSEKDRKAHQDAIEQATAPFEDKIKELETKYKRKATPAERSSLATTYQKMRFGLQQ